MDVNVTVTLPDEIIEANNDMVSRSVFEQVVAEAYKNGRLSLKQVDFHPVLRPRILFTDIKHRATLSKT